MTMGRGEVEASTKASGAARIPRSAPRPPGPKGFPVVGTMPHMRLWPLRFFVNSAKKYGDVVRLGPRLYLVNHPDHIRHILQDNMENYRKNAGGPSQLGTRSVALSEGEVWDTQRRRMQPLFQRRRVNAWAPHVTAATDRMLERWEPISRQRKSLRVDEEMTRLVLEALVATMFGEERPERVEEIVQAVDTIHRFFNRRSRALIQLPARIQTPAKRRYQAAVTAMKSYVEQAITARREASDGTSLDLLGMMATAQHPESGETMDDQQLHDEVVMLLVLGHQTTAMALTWTWYLLSGAPQVEEELRQELEEVLSGRSPTPEDASKLGVLRRVLEESLRLYPPTWLLGRTVVADDVIGGYHIPRHATVFFGPYLMHRHPDFWVNPETFDPSRFSPERSAGRPRFAYFPFGGGPRRCIASNFAMMEIPLVMARVAQRFRLVRRGFSRMRPHAAIILQPRNGFKARLVALRSACKIPGKNHE